MTDTYELPPEVVTETARIEKKIFDQEVYDHWLAVYACGLQHNVETLIGTYEVVSKDRDYWEVKMTFERAGHTTTAFLTITLAHPTMSAAKAFATNITGVTQP